jgi:hypothetical protein
MNWIQNLFRFTAAVWCALLFAVVHDNDTPAAVTVTSYERVAVGVSSFSPAATSTVVPASTTTTTETAPRLCGEWWVLALQAGWRNEHMQNLDYIMWRESRCDSSQHNTTLNADGSSDVGLTQINDWSWCLPTRWYPTGYLQSLSILTRVGCEQLFDPYINLVAAKAIYDYSEKTNGNGWQPWGL